ncbi:MAG: AlpA family phage regulatory protein [Anaerolineae bacterium]|nr:AlpA family phage regulatory protein [Anaerolineae bacterium]
MHALPETGYLRLPQIIGQDGVTDEQAEANRRRQRGPKRPKPSIPALIPTSKSTWWAGVRSGRFPKPVKIGERITAWRVEDIRALIEQQRGEQGGV